MVMPQVVMQVPQMQKMAAIIQIFIFFIVLSMQSFCKGTNIRTNAKGKSSEIRKSRIFFLFFFHYLMGI